LLRGNLLRRVWDEKTSRGTLLFFKGNWERNLVERGVPSEEGKRDSHKRVL